MKVKNCMPVAVVIMFFSLAAFSQQRTVSYNLADMLSSGKLSVTNRQASKLQVAGSTGIKFSSAGGEGAVWLNDIIFRDGVIELDIKGKNIEQQSFVGIAFHGVQDAKTFDVVYLRPFNFKAADSVKRSHSIQYASHPEYPWQVLREKFNGKYENAILPAPEPDNWFHIRIEVNYPLIKTYVNGAATPSIVVSKLNERKSGILGLWVGNNSDGDFANLKVTFNN